MSAPVSAKIVNSCHNAIDLFTPKYKKLCQKATGGSHFAEKSSIESNDIIKFIERVETCGEDFGWKTAGENIVVIKLSVFETLGKLTIDIMKAPCDPKWSDSSAQDVQFCIMCNMMLVFIKNSITQSVINDVKDKKAKWITSSGVNRASLLIIIYNKNTHCA